jgi:hypothetical protein
VWNCEQLFKKILGLGMVLMGLSKSVGVVINRDKTIQQPSSSIYCSFEWRATSGW